MFQNGIFRQRVMSPTCNQKESYTRLTDSKTDGRTEICDLYKSVLKLIAILSFYVPVWD